MCTGVDLILFFTSQATAMFPSTVNSFYQAFFFLGKLDLAVNQYLVHNLSLVNFWKFHGKHKTGDWRVASARLTTGGHTVFGPEQDTLYPCLVLIKLRKTKIV